MGKAKVRAEAWDLLRTAQGVKKARSGVQKGNHVAGRGQVVHSAQGSVLDSSDSRGWCELGGRLLRVEGAVVKLFRRVPHHPFAGHSIFLVVQHMAEYATSATLRRTPFWQH